MRPMDRNEVIRFLSEGTRTGTLATVRPDGRPHAAPVWFVVDGDVVVFTTWSTTVKGRNLRRRPQAAMSVDLAEPPYAFVLVEGSVDISEDPDELLAAATALGARYMGPGRAEEFGRRNGVPGELLCRLSMDHVVGRQAVAE